MVLLRFGQLRSTRTGYRQLQLHPHLDGKLLVLSDMGDKRISQDNTVSWLLLGARRSTFQYGVDVSMPAEPTPRCSGEAASKSFLEPLERKPFLMSFKGRLERPWGKQVAALHDDHDVVIVGDANADYDAEFLLWNSVFNLVFATANHRNSRFNEVVCSGGIPVAMADASWVPPFDGFIRFSSYGVLIEDSDPSNLLPRLRDVLLNTAEVHILRESLGLHKIGVDHCIEASKKRDIATRGMHERCAHDFCRLGKCRLQLPWRRWRHRTEQRMTASAWC